MEFITPAPTGKGPAEQFTGDVWFDVIYSGKEPLRARTNMVRFAPGARAFWHPHRGRRPPEDVRANPPEAWIFARR